MEKETGVSKRCTKSGMRKKSREELEPFVNGKRSLW